MRILMYCNKFGGPTTTFIQNDLAFLASQHEVRHLCIERDMFAKVAFSDIEVVPFRRNPVITKILWILEKKGWYLSYKNRAFRERVNAIIDSFKPDLILCNFGIEALVLTDNLSQRNSKIPVVINFLGYDASFHLNRPSYVSKLKALTQLSNVYATSNTFYLKKNLEVKGVCFKENRVIHTGVNLDFFVRNGYVPSHKEYIFLQVALLSQRKGQEVTIHAFHRMLTKVSDRANYKLILAGGEENEVGAAIRKLPFELGIGDQVEFTSWVTPTQSRQLMMEANCFVHHSRSVNGRTEGVPTAISEAMAMELPVIATWHAGIPELVEEGENGFLVEENDVETYASRMLEIQSFHYLEINRKKVELEFNLKRRKDEMEQFFKEILRLHGKTQSSE
jgi:colanic acid/amylovoran biosynthesis glycosyltransferase